MLLSRYTTLIRATLVHAIDYRRPGPVGLESSSPTILMESGLAFVRHVVGGEPIPAIPLHPAARCVDGAGHSRSMYPGLLRYALRQPAEIDPRLLLDRTTLPASESRQFVGQLWSLLSTPHARRVAQHFASLQQPTGQWFATSPHDNPESIWYHEIVALHALTTASGIFDDAALRSAVARSARYIAAEVQPDHASNQPWALHALLTEPSAIPLADMMLHIAGVQDPAHMDAVSLILLADALRHLESSP
jgi:hypothetical protein